nr:isoaspartyl peptidase/L-asparaginase [Pseudomaricurvus alkylphenolicus]
MVIHGGAGTIAKSDLTPKLEQAYLDQLKQALHVGYGVLENGGTSLDAVSAAVVVLEDSPLFNAGKGSSFSHEGRNELDASIMDGRDLSAGAVAGVRLVKNPIKLARTVMENSVHVMMAGSGAEAFARENALEMVEPDYFYTERRWQMLQRAKYPKEQTRIQPVAPLWEERKMGTVGAVAIDSEGNLAAATSTGGMTNKRYQRIGDSPIIGAGTYADNASCAVSATGHGEYFIRANVAHDICARLMYKKIPLQQAADEVIQQKLVSMGAKGGIIAIDNSGEVVMNFNTTGMYRGKIGPDGLEVAVYGEKAVISGE